MRSPVFGLIGLVLVLVALAVGSYYVVNGMPPPAEEGSEVPTPAPGPASLTEGFSSAEFEVALRHPAAWEVSTTSLAGETPALNVYLPGSGDAVPPYTHHNNVTQVSFFPKGIPTEGLMAESRPLDFDPGFAATNSRVFILEDGTPFAAYIQLEPDARPESWDEFGFMWVGVHVDGLATRCVNEAGETAPEANCDIPMTPGHKVVWSGTRSLTAWQEALAILRSIRFEE